MIFKQWQQVLDGTKTQTRRLVKVGERLHGVAWGTYHNPAVIAWRRIKWMAGRTYAVQPGRGQPAIWVGPDGAPHDAPLAEYLRKSSSVDAPRWGWGKRVKAWLREHGYREARLHITGIRRERVQDISIFDIRAEGIEKQLSWTSFEMREAFAELWDSIHKKAGTRWTDNPAVWVLEFELASTDAGTG